MYPAGYKMCIRGLIWFSESCYRVRRPIHCRCLQLLFLLFEISCNILDPGRLRRYMIQPQVKSRDGIYYLLTTILLPFKGRCQGLSLLLDKQMLHH